MSAPRTPRSAMTPRSINYAAKEAHAKNKKVAKARTAHFTAAFKAHREGLLDAYNGKLNAKYQNHWHEFTERNLVSPLPAGLPKRTAAQVYTRLNFDAEGTIARKHHDLITKIVKEKISFTAIHELSQSKIKVGDKFMYAIDRKKWLDEIVEAHFLIPHPELGIKGAIEPTIVPVDYRAAAKDALRVYLIELAAWKFLDKCSAATLLEVKREFEKFKDTRDAADLDKFVNSVVELFPLLEVAHSRSSPLLKRALLSYFQFKEDYSKKLIPSLTSKSFPWLYVSPVTAYGNSIKKKLTISTDYYIHVIHNGATKEVKSASEANVVSELKPVSEVKSSELIVPPNLPLSPHSEWKEASTVSPRAVAGRMNELSVPPIKLPPLPLVVIEEGDSPAASRPSTPISKRAPTKKPKVLTLDELKKAKADELAKLKKAPMVRKLHDMPSYGGVLTCDPFYWAHVLGAVPVEIVLAILNECHAPKPLKALVAAPFMGAEVISYLATHGLSFCMQEIAARINDAIDALNESACCKSDDVKKVTEHDDIGPEPKSARASRIGASSERKDIKVSSLPSPLAATSVTPVERKSIVSPQSSFALPGAVATRSSSAAAVDVASPLSPSSSKKKLRKGSSSHFRSHSHKSVHNNKPKHRSKNPTLFANSDAHVKVVPTEDGQTVMWRMGSGLSRTNSF